MKHEHSDDEWGFWEPDRAPRTAWRRDRDEPTRALGVVRPGARHHGVEPVAVTPAEAVDVLDDDLLGLFDDLGPADALPGLDELDDAGEVAVVSTRRRTWRERLRRDDRGRLDPFVARVGVLLVAGAIVLPVAVAAGGGDATAAGTAVARSVVVTTSAAPASAADLAPAASAAPSSTGARRSTVTPTAATAVAPAIAPPSAAAVAAPTAGDGTEPASSSASTPAPVKRVQTAVDATSRCGADYEILPGDYWLGIADRADVDVDELLAVNGAVSSTPLYPGRDICLPVGASTPAPATTDAPTTATATTDPPTTAAKATTMPPATAAAAAAKATTTDAPVTTKAPSTTAKPTTTKAPATTAKPATTTASATTSPPRTYTRDQVAQIIRDVWPDDLEDKAIAIATRESNLTPAVRNFCCFGLFQIYFNVHAGWLAGMGVTEATQLYDPLVNAQAALALYFRNGGWGPWGG